MTDYKKLSICIVDNGLFTHMAEAMTEYFGVVYYYVPWEFTFPRMSRMLLGDGIPGVSRIDSFWPYLGEIDLFVFPDVNFAPLQLHLRSLDKRIWGSGGGEQLELDRAASKRHLKSLGIDIGPYTVVTGITALRKHLGKHPDQYVKISRYRGDMESFHAVSLPLIEPLLDELEYRFGARKETVEFICEDAISDAVEIGFDGWTIDGQFTENCTRGVEVKDLAFIMRSGSYADMPKQLRDINTKLAPTFERFGYRGFFSSEARITRDGKAYVIDPCCRLPSPPSQLYWSMIKNWADILWEGADGAIVEPDLAAPWGALAILTSDHATKNWQPIAFPKELRDSIRITNLSMLDGRYYFVPQDGYEMAEIGAVVGLGDTMEDAIKAVGEVADKVEGYAIHTNLSALDEAQSELDKLKEFGIEL